MTNKYLLACAFGEKHDSVLTGENNAQLPAQENSSFCWVRSDEEQSLRDKAADCGCDLLLFSEQQLAEDKKLLVMDFDSTMVTTEGLDILASTFGVGDVVASLTARAMRGELDFKQSVTARVAMLAGMKLQDIQEAATKQPLQNGMEQLCKKAKQAGLDIAIVSGGFDICIEPVAGQLGIHNIVCNHFGVLDGRLDGKIIPPIIDANAKQQGLLDLCNKPGHTPRNVIALGDGANDIPMLNEAAIGIALHPKPKVRQLIPNAIDFSPIDCISALFAAIRYVPKGSSD